MSLVAYLSDLLRYTTPPEEPANIILRLFLNTLHYLNGDERDIEQLKVIFELRLACEIGLMPQLIGCKECYLSSSDKMYFNLYEGNLICENCLTGDELAKSLPLDKTMLHIIRYICLSDFNKIFNFKITEKYQKKVSLVSEKYLKIQLSRYFKSLEFYENI